MDTHDLTAAYALHALDDVEREAYEQHLAQCERCREELGVLTESAAALAWAVESPAPPAQLRRRILDASAGDNVVPFRARARRPWQAIAAVAACAAIGLGIWGATVNNSLHRERTRSSTLHIVADPASRKVELHGKPGMVAVAPDGEGVLVVEHLPAAPAGMTYEAWVIPHGGKPQRAGVFRGGDDMTMVKLGMHVPHGATVAATVEKHGGADAPTSPPLLSAQV
jgi:anti-sigma-K factor RskA